MHFFAQRIVVGLGLFAAAPGTPARSPLDYWDILAAKWAELLKQYFFNRYTELYSKEILIALLALVLIIFIFMLLKVVKSFRGEKPKLQSFAGKFESPKAAGKAAKLAAKAGNPVRAGELFEQAEQYSKSVDAYLKGKAFTRAANVMAKKLNQPEKALALLKEKNLNDPAAQLLEGLDRFGEAAQYYQKAGKLQTAAELFEKAGDLKTAGELYRGQKMYPEAARCFGKIQAWLPAAEMYELYYKQYRQAVANREGPKEAARLQDLAKRAAYNWKQAGEPKRSAEVLQSARLNLFAAEMFALAGESQKAAEMYFEEKELKKAAELFHQAGDKKRAAEIVSQIHLQEGRKLEGAKYLELAEEYLAAADLYAGEGQYEKAAQLFMKGGDSRTAAEMLMAGGQIEKAVAMFEAQGDLDAAVRLCEESGNQLALAGIYERKGKVFEAAAVYSELGQPGKAEALLNRVSPEHPRFAESCAKMGEILMMRGENQKALEKLQAMAGRMPLSPQSMDQYYLLAQAYERLDHLMYALGIYQQLMALNIKYKDVTMRVNLLAQKIQAMGGAYAATVAGGGWGKSHSTIGNRYRVVQELGRGGMGVVYLAEDLHLERKVAFKVLSEELKGNKEMVENFIREARSLAQLNHQYIVSIFDAGQEGGVWYIIMEYVAGKNFKELMAGNRRLPLAAGVQAFTQLAEALDFAHSLKVIHRDVKPANIMWTQTKIIKVMDFGLAKIMDQMREKKGTVIAGTPFYMSPEQSLGRSVDHRSDIYSMGVTIYELLTGRVPFPEGDIGYHHLHTQPPQPRQFNNQITPELEKIILKCMAKDPGQRYQSARQVYEELLRSFGPGRT